MADRRIGRILVEDGALTEEHLASGLEKQALSHDRLGTVLLDAGHITLPALRTALARQSGRPVATLDGLPEPAAADLVPKSLIARTRVLPLRIRGSVITVGALDPGDTEAIERVRLAGGYGEVVAEVLAEAELRHFITKSLGQSWGLSESPEQAALRSWSPPAPAEVDEALAEPLLSWTMAEALKRNASSVSFVPLGGGGRVEVRVDGATQTLAPTSARVVEAVARSLASVASGGEMGSVEATWQGQTGRFETHRVMTGAGTRTVLRRVDYAPVGTRALNLSGPVAQELSRRQRTRGGLYLVVGPRDGGLFGTAQGLAADLGAGGAQCLTISRHSSVGAASIRPEPSLVDAITAAIAQDPDVLLVDGVTSPEAASLVVEAAMVGHTVVATMPGRRAVDAALDLAAAASPYRVAAALQAVVAQRLCRQTCPDCAVGFELTDSERAEFGLAADTASSGKFRRGKGCGACFGTGYRGRLPIAEVLFASDGVRQAIRANARADALTEVAREAGFHTCWETGIVAMVKGLTTPEELRTVLGA